MPDTAPRNAARKRRAGKRSPGKRRAGKQGRRSAAFRLAAFGAAARRGPLRGLRHRPPEQLGRQRAAPPPATARSRSRRHRTHAGTMSHDDAGSRAARSQRGRHGLSGSGSARRQRAGSVGGLALTASGLTLRPRNRDRWPAGKNQPFASASPERAAPRSPPTRWCTTSRCTSSSIRRDLTGFQHLHPTMAPDGTWSIDLTLAEPGSYRAIADFTAVVGGPADSGHPGRRPDGRRQLRPGRRCPRRSPRRPPTASPFRTRAARRSAPPSPS